MKQTQTSYLLTLGALFFLALGAVGTWFLLRWLEPRNPAATGLARWWPGALLLVLLLISGSWLYRFVQTYFFHIRELREQAALILHVNPAHRVALDGPAEIRALAGTINEFGVAHEQILAERDEQLRVARADLEEERNMLAALMSELSSGILVCNLDGQILLYNRSARHLLAQDTASESDIPGSTGAGGFVGLGRSVFGLIDREAITHALAQLTHYHAAAGRREPVHTFVITTGSGTLLRARMAPFAGGADDQLAGFILALQDMTAGIEASSRRDFLLQTFTEKVRASLGNMRAAIETISAFPEMPASQQDDFHGIIEEEARELSGLLDETMRTYAQDLKAQWRLEEMSSSDLLWAIRNRLEQDGCAVTLVEPSTPVWLKIDSYALVHGTATLVRLLQQDYQIDTMELRLLPNALTHTHNRRSASESPGHYAALDLGWQAPQNSSSQWQGLTQQAFAVDDSDATLSLKEVAERHGGEVWFQQDDTGRAYFRLLLPRTRSEATAADRPTPTSVAPRPVSNELESRPEYYDFDLFHQLGQRPEVDAQPLRALSYTVFDSETTGLDPNQDEIISLGAVRIVNGRMLRQEVFDRLINPGRSIPAVATNVHGISNAMVAAEPRITAVLPSFGRFAEETVLVAHNAAFDMRMLQQQETATGVRFINPVLDTLLLSAVVHPNQSDHSLEEIAKRLGINVLGRHTALGDAIVTAEVFLRLIPLLEQQGIHTLGDARTAAQQTYFARIQY